jgi:hypothetical protein
MKSFENSPKLQNGQQYRTQQSNGTTLAHRWHFVHVDDVLHFTKRSRPGSSFCEDIDSSATGLGIRNAFPSFRRKQRYLGSQATGGSAWSGRNLARRSLPPFQPITISPTAQSAIHASLNTGQASTATGRAILCALIPAVCHGN